MHTHSFLLSLIPLRARLQAHMSRSPLNPDMAADAREVVGKATRLLQAMVDVISSSGWLNPALAGAHTPRLPPYKLAVVLPLTRSQQGCCRQPQIAGHELITSVCVQLWR